MSDDLSDFAKRGLAAQRAVDQLGAAAPPLARPGSMRERLEREHAEHEQAHAAELTAAIERSVDELRSVVARIPREELAKLPELERRLITETRAHLAEYDRAKRGTAPPRCAQCGARTVPFFRDAQSFATYDCTECGWSSERAGKRGKGADG